jgi:hypothetical protein
MWFGIQEKTFQRNAQLNIQNVTVEGMVGIYLSLTSTTHFREIHLTPLNINICLRFLKQCFITVVKLPYASGYLKCYCMVCEKFEYYWNRKVQIMK